MFVQTSEGTTQRTNKQGKRVYIVESDTNWLQLEVTSFWNTLHLLVRKSSNNPSPQLSPLSMRVLNCQTAIKEDIPVPKWTHDN
jgi:hypothetical protein